MPAPIITLLTDFGLADHYVAAMKGVMLGICPDASLVDVSHQVPAFDIVQAAYTLSQAWQCFPAGTVHLVVVDPGVGGERRPIVVAAGAHLFVGPDNGVLSPVIRSDPEYKVFQISSTRYFRAPVSQTFHGRDIFAPVAAWLATGVPVDEVGTAITDTVLTGFEAPVACGGGRWLGVIQATDRFGNLVTNLKTKDFPELRHSPFVLRIGSRSVTAFRPTYANAPSGELFLVPGSGGYLEVSLNQSDAATLVGFKEPKAAPVLELVIEL